MKTDYNDNDYAWIKELRHYPQMLKDRLRHFTDTSEIIVPEDPIERVVFQDRAKKAIRKIAHKRGHILMVGRPGTGKSMLAGMLQDVLARSLNDYIRPCQSILAFPGKDRNHIRIAYEDPEQADRLLDALQKNIAAVEATIPVFSLGRSNPSVASGQIRVIAGDDSAGRRKLAVADFAGGCRHYGHREYFHIPAGE